VFWGNYGNRKDRNFSGRLKVSQRAIGYNQLEGESVWDPIGACGVATIACF